MNIKHVKLEIDTKTFVRFLLVVSIFVGAVFMVWKTWAALMIVLVAFFLALALNPPVNAIANRLPGHSRIMATTIAYLVVLSVLGLFVYVAVPPVIDQTNQFIEALPEYIAQVSDQRGIVADFVNRYNLQEQLNQVVSGAQEQASGLAQGVGTSLVSGVSSILSGFVTLLMVLVLTFLMLIEGPRWIERMWYLYTDASRLRRHQRLAAKMYKVVSGYVNGQVLVATIATAAGLTTLLILTYFFAVPVGSVLPLAGIIFVSSLIPMIGATIGAGIVVLVLLFSDIGGALAFLAYYLIYQQIENNFIQPVVQSRTVALSALAVLVAAIIGITVLGLIGGILAIPVAGCLRVLLLDYMEHRKKKPHPQHGNFAKMASSGE